MLTFWSFESLPNEDVQLHIAHSVFADFPAVSFNFVNYETVEISFSWVGKLTNSMYGGRRWQYWRYLHWYVSTQSTIAWHLLVDQAQCTAGHKCKWHLESESKKWWRCPQCQYWRCIPALICHDKHKLRVTHTINWHLLIDLAWAQYTAGLKCKWHLESESKKWWQA